MRAFTLALGLLLCAGQASAANAYKFYDVDVENAPAVLAATDAFMNSETGKRFKGALHLNTYLANGASPATHAFVMLMPSMAAITAWEAEMAASNDGASFFSSLRANAEATGESMGAMLKAWGDTADDDRVWMVTRFYTTNPLAVLAAQEKLMASPEMKNAPGQVHLNSVAVGNRSGANNSVATHMFAVGYKSVEEMEGWTQKINASPAWAEYLTSLRDVVTWHGTDLLVISRLYDQGMSISDFAD